MAKRAAKQHGVTASGKRGKLPAVKPVYGPQPSRFTHQIKIGKRFRHDMGDIAGLARSIDERGGLIKPVAIDAKDRLIAGERSIRAWEKSRFADRPIPVHVIDVDSLIAGERDENEQRKNFTLSESVAIKQAIEAELKPAAQARIREHGGTAPGRTAIGTPSKEWLDAFAPKQSGQVAQGDASCITTTQSESPRSAGRVADIAARATGRSRRTLEKAEAVVAAAEADPARFGKLREQMDRTGRADGVFQRLKIMRARDAILANPPRLPAAGITVWSMDFPWPHEPEAEQEEIDARGRSTRPFPAMSIKAGCKFMAEQVKPLLAKDCTGFFWTTGYHMPYAFHLLSAAGFTKHSAIASWRKERIGRGQVLRDKTEFCIVVKKGSPVINLTNQTTDWSGWSQPRGNSQKPDEFYALVEELCPAARYVEFFSTVDRPNWDAYGDQVGTRLPAKSAKYFSQDAGEGKTLESGERRPALDLRSDEALGAALDDIDCSMEVGAGIVAELIKHKLVIGKKAPRLTKAGSARLAEWREANAHAEQLALLPADIDTLVKLYGAAIRDLHSAALAGKPTRPIAERMELLEEKAHGGLEGSGCDDSPAERLRAENAAPIGTEPMWGQRGVFAIDVDGMRAIIEYHDIWIEAHAVNPDQPFISDTGFHAFTCDDNDENEGGFPRATIAAHAAALIREDRDTPLDTGGSKRVPRKKPLPMPEKVYRLPTSWGEKHAGEFTGPVPISKKQARISITAGKDKLTSAAADRGTSDAATAASGAGGSASAPERPAPTSVLEQPVLDGALRHVEAGESNRVTRFQLAELARLGFVIKRKAAAAPQLTLAGKTRLAWLDQQSAAASQPAAASPAPTTNQAALDNALDAIAKGRRDVHPTLVRELTRRGLIAGDPPDLTEAGWKHGQAVYSAARARAPPDDDPDNLKIPGFLRRNAVAAE